MGGLGINEREDKAMQHDFHYIPKKDPKVKKAYEDIQSILKGAQDLVREEFTFRFDVVGSYKRNMITYDAKSNVGYDFDIDIEVNDSSIYPPKKLKTILRNTIGNVCTTDEYYMLPEQVDWIKENGLWNAMRDLQE